MAKKEFKRAQSADFVIMDDGKVFGSLRLKPSTVLWASKGGHDWKGISIEAFSEFMEKTGKAQKK